jgi:polyisoprenyl-teichoic acid--peptidoglycan teichoic acid transferase
LSRLHRKEKAARNIHLFFIYAEYNAGKEDLLYYESCLFITMFRKLILAAAMLSLLTACAVQAQVAPVPPPVSILVTADPNATATATPFQPIAPTTTRVITNTPTPLPATATPVITPTPTEIPLPEGVTNIMLLGTDWRPESGARADVVMLISINATKGTVSIVSFPRDLYVTMPGWGQDRINTAKAYGGFPLLQSTMEYNFWVRPTHYISTNMQGFIGIINSLGGIDIYAGQYLEDRCDVEQAENGVCTIKPGRHHMDGETALWYVRSRMTSSDFDRTRRAQEVVLGIFNKLLSMSAITRAPDLYRQFKNSVETDMTLEDMLPLLPVAAKLNEPERIKRYAIGPAEAWDYRTETGARVLLPNYDAIYPIILEAVYSK